LRPLRPVTGGPSWCVARLSSACVPELALSRRCGVGHAGRSGAPPASTGREAATPARANGIGALRASAEMTGHAPRPAGGGGGWGGGGVGGGGGGGWGPRGGGRGGGGGGGGGGFGGGGGGGGGGGEGAHRRSEVPALSCGRWRPLRVPGRGRLVRSLCKRTRTGSRWRARPQDAGWTCPERVGTLVAGLYGVYCYRRIMGVLLNCRPHRGHTKDRGTSCPVARLLARPPRGPLPEQRTRSLSFFADVTYGRSDDGGLLR